MKDFDKWNKRKKQIDSRKKESFYHERELWWCSLGANIGFEQDGTGNDYERPVLVLKGFSRHVCLIVPLTTSKKKNKFYVTAGVVDGKKATAIISQLRLVDTKRLINKIGFLNKGTFEQIRKAIKDML